MEFQPDGNLRYAIVEGDREQVMLLTWRTEGDVIITDQTSQPREERTRYAFAPDGKLRLTNQGVTSQFVGS